ASGFARRPQVMEPNPPARSGKVFRSVLLVTSRWNRSSTNVGAQVIRKYQVKLMAKYCRQSNTTVFEASRSRHGKPCGAGFGLFASNASSPSFTPAFSRGLSLYQAAKATVQIAPRQAKTVKASRQSMYWNSSATSSGVNAPPQRELIQM